jgi:HD-like signal output (HDOD) protein
MQKAVRKLAELPPFSPILNRLLASLASEDVSFAKLGDLIEKDTLVAGNLLHLVNSALYARRGTINSVRHAVSILGINKLRNAVLGMSVARMWSQVHTPPSWSMARFNMHSASSAILCDLLAQRLPVTYPEGAFVSGLFHDTGRMLIALALGEEHSKVVEMRKQGVFSPLECEDRVLGFTHPELSAEAMVFWKLPEQIQRAVRDHHQPAADPDAKAGEIPLSRVVDAANQLVNSEGLSIIENLPGEFADATIIEGLGLDAKVVTALLSEYKTEAGAMAQFFK